MIVDVTDRVPTNPGRVYLNPVGDNTFDLLRADNPTKEGTAINREVLMGIQGFTACTTTFNSDGSITETGTTGTRVTTFNSDGSITEKFTNKSGVSIQKKTTFNADGSITETVS